MQLVLVRNNTRAVEPDRVVLLQAGPRWVVRSARAFPAPVAVGDVVCVEWLQRLGFQ